jgi:hypothetical protein
VSASAAAAKINQRSGKEGRPDAPILQGSLSKRRTGGRFAQAQVGGERVSLLPMIGERSKHHRVDGKKDRDPKYQR